MVQDRISRLRDFISMKGLDGIFISKQENVHYFSGFTGDDSLLLVTGKKAFLITDSRYTEQASAQAPLYEISEQKDGLIKHAATLSKSLGMKQTGFEGSSLSFDAYKKFVLLADSISAWVPVSLDRLREIKEQEEIALIRKAVEISDEAFSDVIGFIREGVSEIEVAAHLENRMRELGSEKPSFDTIVASGARGSLPHGIATEKLLKSGEFVTMDFGAVYQGYHSDITRTVVVGEADEKHRKLYDIVLRSQMLGESEVKPGASGVAVDRAVRNFLKEYGYGFGHGLGHSLGLEIHEQPTLSPHSTCDALMPGMLITVEPGVYLPGWGGLRIEDTVLVTEEGSEPLTKSSKHLIETGRRLQCAIFAHVSISIYLQFINL